jgi:hypothetical protein
MSGNSLWVIAERLHDGAPPHCSRAVRDVLSNTRHERGIGRGGPTAWPPRSPDLNPLDFCWWGHLATLVYAAPVYEEAHRLVDACQITCNYPGIFARMWRPMRCVEACIESHGGHSEHWLQMHFSAVTHKLNVSGHMLICSFFLFGMWNSCPKFVPTFELHSVHFSVLFIVQL